MPLISNDNAVLSFINSNPHTHIMKTKSKYQVPMRSFLSLIAWRAVLMLAVFTGIQLAHASVLVKADNTANLNLTTAWANNVVPGINDIAQWDSTVSANNTTNNLGASTTWNGIRIINPGGPVQINADGSTLTNGTSGIDMSVASQSLTLSNNVVLGSGPQNWSVASGQTLALGGSLLRNGGSGLRFNLPDLSASGAQVSLTNGTPNWLLGGTTNSSFGNLFFATINNVDIAALDGSGHLVGESTIGSLQAAGLCQGNVAGANPTQNTTCLAEIFNNTGSYGARVTGSFTYSCMLFNLPQTYNVTEIGR